MSLTKNHTSAINGMPVTEMRKCLAEVREFLLLQNYKNPFYFKHKLSNGMEIWEFVHQVSNGLHDKRINLRNKKKRVDEE